MRKRKKNKILFESLSVLDFYFKYLLIQVVIHFLDVCSQNVVYKFLDHPFVSMKNEKIFIKNHFFSWLLLYKLHIEWLKQQLEEKRFQFEINILKENYQQCLFVLLVYLQQHFYHYGHELILFDVHEP